MAYWRETGADQVVSEWNSSTADGADGVVRGEVRPISLVLNNNTGTDLSITATYAAVQFSPGNVTTFGAVRLRLKKSVSLGDLASITANVYADVAGKPGVLLSINNGATTVYGINLSTSTYTVKEFLLRLNGASPNVPYWVVFTFANLAGQTFILDSAASGGTYATSPDGTTWTNTESAPYIECRGQNIAGTQGTAETYVGARGDSTSYFGTYGTTDTGVGAYGNSKDGVGVLGNSVAKEGVRGQSQVGYGVYGTTTNGVGVYGTGGGGGVHGDSTSGFAGVLGTNNQNNGPGVWGDNTASGVGVQGRSVNGTGFGVASEGYTSLTHGWGLTVTAGAGLGTTPPDIVSTGANAQRGMYTFGTGTSPADGAAVVIGFPGGRPMPNTPGAILLRETTAATIALGLYISAISTTGFTVSMATAPAASQANTVYGFSVVAFG